MNVKIYRYDGRKDEQGKVFLLQNIETLQYEEFDKDYLKSLMRQGNISVQGLILSSDNRLISTDKDSLLDNYYRSCALLGVEPLDIICRAGKYIVINIPNNTKTLTIPDFVDKIELNKSLHVNVNPNYITSKLLSEVVSLHNVSDEQSKQLKQQLDLISKQLKAVDNTHGVCASAQ